MDIETFILRFGRHAFVFLVALAVFLVLLAMLLTWGRQRRSKEQINQRLKIQAEEQNNQTAYVELLHKRGLTRTGRYQLPFVRFNRLVLQSGVSIPILQILLLMGLLFVGSATVAFTMTGNEVLSVLIAIGCGIAAPVMVLYILRSRRHAKFEAQLPEAIDVMVRSMRAGHPLPVAVSLVAREMPDPVGSEFGLVADEMTYGLDLEMAMGNLRARAGQSDLSFLVVAISIQAKSGGNLAEILGNLSRMVRERAKMRRKIHSLSAEGRFSAVALSIIPCLIYIMVSLTAPGYYGDVRNDPLFMQSVYFALTIWSTGVYVMYRMVNFKI
jgi:tight adherence protein B